MEGMVLDSVKYSCSLSHSLQSVVDRSSSTTTTTTAIPQTPMHEESAGDFSFLNF
jgi:hypothetical protein